MTLLFKGTFCLITAATLGACGGGGGDGGTPEDTVIGSQPDRTDISNDPLPPTTPENWFVSYPTADGVEFCSTEDLKAWVDHDMHDYYIYADSVPDVRLADYRNEAELLRALRVEPDSFSSISDTGEYDDRYEEGIVVAYGYRWRNIAGATRFLRVDSGSPAALAGLQRGDTLVALDGIAADDLETADYDRIFDVDEGVPVRFTVRTGEAAPRDLDIARDAYRFQTVPMTQHIDYADGRQVGYLVVSSFLEPTDARLDTEIARLAESNVTELVLDLRYNGGGRSRVANRLASRLGGEAIQGELYAMQMRNARYASFDEVEPFRAVDQSLNLSRLVVLTTSATASASENLTNSLKPFMDVTVIGQRTRGKNFSSQGIDYCGKTINAMNSIIVNSNNVSVAGGIEPDCVVEDVPDVAIGETGDPLRDAGLAYLQNGACPTGVAAKRTHGGHDLPEDPAFAPDASRDRVAVAVRARSSHSP